MSLELDGLDEIQADDVSTSSSMWHRVSNLHDCHSRAKSESRASNSNKCDWSRAISTLPSCFRRERDWPLSHQRLTDGDGPQPVIVRWRIRILDLLAAGHQ